MRTPVFRSIQQVGRAPIRPAQTSFNIPRYQPGFVQPRFQHTHTSAQIDGRLAKLERSGRRTQIGGFLAASLLAGDIVFLQLQLNDIRGDSEGTLSRY